MLQDSCGYQTAEWPKFYGADVGFSEIYKRLMVDKQGYRETKDDLGNTLQDMLVEEELLLYYKYTSIKPKCSMMSLHIFGDMLCMLLPSLRILK